MYLYTAFDGFEEVASGGLESVALALRKYLRKVPKAQILIFSDFSGRQIDLDLSGSEAEVLERLHVFTKVEPHKPVTAVGPGRPKLGVVAREVSLLPSHWEWLNMQDGGASATLRKLIDERVKLLSSEKEKLKSAQEVIYKVASSLGGDLPNYEDLIRYLYRKDKAKFCEAMEGWPKDLSKYIHRLSKDLF